jgi:transposase
MFLKEIKKGKKGGQQYTYYRLCESVRMGSQTRHHNLLNLGTLDGLSADDRKALANRIEGLYLGYNDMFLTLSPLIENLAADFYKQLREKYQQERLAAPSKTNAQSMTTEPVGKDLECIDLNSLQHDEVREVGAEWLCLQAIEQLGLSQLLLDNNWDKPSIDKALSLIVGRAVYPASEYKTAQWMQRSSAVTELVFGRHQTLTHHQLYKIGDRLYDQQAMIEKHLSTTTNDLFNISDKIVLYDLTNTYFEGRKAHSELAQFGRSKEKRNDAKLVSMALVINAEGFVKHSKIYEGNIYEPHTLLTTIESLAQHTQRGNPVVVIDAGIATEENLSLLKLKGYDYLCVSRSKLKQYTLTQPATQAVEITDNRNNKITLQCVNKVGCTDQYLHIRSDQKALKEASMEQHYSKKFEQELDNVAKGIHTKGGTKKSAALHQRLGRIKERYPAANKHYTINLEEKDQRATKLTYSRKPLANATPTHGVYFIRTSLQQKDEASLWAIYNTLTEVEASFRTLKTDLSLRPIFHQKDERTIAHLHLGVLAYMVVNVIRYKLKQNNIHHDWSNIVRIMNTQKLVTTSFQNEKGQLTSIKKCSQPSKEVLAIYQATKYKTKPFAIKKYVLPQNPR